MLTAITPRLRSDALLIRATSWAVAQAPAVGGWLSRAARRGRTLALQLCGLGAVTAAAWDVARPLGLFTLGVSLLVLEGLSTGADEEASR